jgi:hypothetical protein
MKAVSPANLLLIGPIDLHPRFHVVEGVLWDTIENLPHSLCPSWEGTTKITHLCNIMNAIDRDVPKKLDKE